jgi:translation initiation factor IF-2
MPKKRVHEIAKEQGLTSKEVLQALKDAGVYVKAASSTVEERDIRRAFPNGSKVAADKQKAAEAAKAAEEEAKKAAEAEAAAKKAEEEARKAAEEEAKKAAEEKAAKVAEETAAKAAEEEAKKAAEAEAAKKAAEEEAEKAKAAEAEAKKTAKEQDAKEAEAEAAKAAEADAEKPARARKSRDGDSESDGAGAPDKPARGTGPRILDPGTTPRGQQQQRDGGGQRAPAGNGGGGGRQRPTRPDERGGQAGGPGRRRVVIDSQASRRPQAPPPQQQPPRRRRGRRRLTPLEEPPPTPTEVVVEEQIFPVASGATVKEVAETLGVPAAEAIKQLMKLGEMATLTQTLTDEAIEVLADALDKKVEIVSAADEVQEIVPADADSPEDLQERPPVVTIMGHVDHGKTSLLDAIRETEVAAGEAGGITQHIGAYQVSKNGNTITFIDTPGHQAFTAMRARGAKVTDIAVIVVAADDGVMPQTVEAIDHAKAAEVPIMIAVNKIDKEGADPNRVRGELAQQGLTPADWGGDTEFVDVSAKTGEGLDDLLETVVTLAEIQELKANPDTEASGTVIESQLDPGRGPVATILVQRGTLHGGDALVAGDAWARVRAMNNFRGEKVEAAPPGMPVEVLGFNSVPDAGEIVRVVENERKARQLAAEREDRLKREALARRSTVRVSLEDVFARAQRGESKKLPLILKADVAGSLEALADEIAKLPQEEVTVEVIHDGVGGINESDVMLAAASDAVIIGFNVRPVGSAAEVASREGVEIRHYSVIYQVVDELRAAMQGMLEPEEVERTVATVEVRAIFRASRIGTIAGSYVVDGTVRRGAQARLVRDGTVVYDGRIATLRRFKDDVREVQAGFECGITLENFMDVKEGDVIEVYEKSTVERTLES